MIEPDVMMSDGDIKGLIDYLNVYVVVPVCITTVILLVMLAVACLYVKQKKREDQKNNGHRFSTASNDMQKGCDSNSLSYMQRNTLNRQSNPPIVEGIEDDPTPYAMCHLSNYPPPLPPPNMMHMGQAPSVSKGEFDCNFIQVHGMNPQFLPPMLPRSFLLGQGNEETTFIFPKLPEDPAPTLTEAPTYTNALGTSAFK